LSRQDATIGVKVSALTVDPFTGLPVVILVDDSGRSVVPISVGIGEASAIATELDHIDLERPMTHQLLASMLCAAGVRIRSIEVCDLIENTFYATVNLTLPNGDRVAQEARPSDALALALHTGSPIRVATRVVNRLARSPARDEWSALVCGCSRTGAYASADDNAELLEGLADEAFGKWKV
jgi:bifunctional DNase/RNase